MEEMQNGDPPPAAYYDLRALAVDGPPSAPLSASRAVAFSKR